MDNDDILYEIKSFGMIEGPYNWIPITCSIAVNRETDKAVHGLITVYEDDIEEDFKNEPLYNPEIYWVPRTQCEKPWYICTILFDEERKVANRRWK